MSAALPVIQGAPDACRQCSAPFVKANAKFCSKCGTKKAAASRRGSQVGVDKSGSTSSNLAASSSINSGGKKATIVSTTSPTPTTTALEKNPIPSPQSPPGLASCSSATASLKPTQLHHDTLSPRGNTSFRKPPHRLNSTTTSNDDVKGKTTSTTQRPNTSDSNSSTNSLSDHMATIMPSAEEEARYTALSTLGPEGLTPDMLQTANVADLKGWSRGSLIGRGTYGSVYLGLLPDGGFYAVKCVELGVRTAADMNVNVRELVSLSREISMMQRLSHRNLCNFKGVLFEPDSTSICMFMEYVSGGSMTSLVKRFKPLPPAVLRSWTKQLLAGLLYLHSQHIIHRDVKGDNVLIDLSASVSSLAQVKLVDFGAARRLTDAMSQSRTVIGTPYWMAPEVVDVCGDGNGYSYKADVWSVGCTVAEMITGKPPWPAKANAPAAIMMIASADGMPTEMPKDEATPGCYDFMTKCFVRNPELRPTVEELLQHPWITGEME